VGQTIPISSQEPNPKDGSRNDRSPSVQCKISSGHGLSTVPNGSNRLELTTQRENALALFHLLGKVLYNKRKDPASFTFGYVERSLEARETLLRPPLARKHYKENRRVKLFCLIRLLYLRG
jgi:hypothetical protein